MKIKEKTKLRQLIKDATGNVGSLDRIEFYAEDREDWQNPQTNPYLLTGDELQRTVDAQARK
jgi:hypothetical protein